MSRVAAGIVEIDIKEGRAAKQAYVLGLASGNSPTGLYRHPAAAFNDERIDASGVRSYSMIQRLFGLLERKFAETSVPWGDRYRSRGIDGCPGAASRAVRDAGSQPGQGHRRQGRRAGGAGAGHVDVPISHGRSYAAKRGNLLYVLDVAAALEVLAHRAEVEVEDYDITYLRSEP